MPTIKSILGYTWASLCTLLIPVMFFGFGFWPEALVKSTGISVSPWYSGGEVQQTVPHQGYRTLIRKPVFDGILGERKDGFVQIDFTPEENQTLPAIITEEIDVDRDGTADFRIRTDTTAGKTEFTSMKEWARQMELTVKADKEVILRIGLKNFHR
jgi:hypothetical protein